MSYDFQLFFPVAGLTPQQVVTVMKKRDLARVKSRKKLSKQACHRIKYIKAELLEYEPALHIFEALDHIDFTAKIAPEQYIQMSLYEDYGGASIGYASSKKGFEPRVYYRAVWEYFLLLERAGGFYFFDCQMVELIDLEEDFEESYICYSNSSRQIFKKSDY